MKLKLIFGGVLVVVSGAACGQNKIKEGTLKVNSSTYKVESMNKSMVVVNDVNAQPRYTKFKSADGVHYKDPNEIFNSFSKIFSASRLRELLPERFMTVVLYYDHTGKVTSVKYYLQKDTKISTTELDSLNRQLKLSVTFELPAKTIDDNLMPYTNNIFFQRLLQSSSVN
ncbi:hypothetical protein [Mucilaginibacter sp. UYCu711]|uniref:hypothetical protein n=1 Tax=Mucilaginibacter sp. UYCu711 TaxID=3156339 RepID=UPI003D2218F4